MRLNTTQFDLETNLDMEESSTSVKQFRNKNKVMRTMTTRHSSTAALQDFRGESVIANK